MLQLYKYLGPNVCYNNMFKCQLCNFASESLKAFTIHFELHRNVANFDFPCAVPSCTRRLKIFAGFKSDIYKDHSKYSNKSGATNCTDNFSLTCQVCASKFKDLHSFCAHLKDHILSGVEVLLFLFLQGVRFSLRTNGHFALKAKW